MTVKRNFTQCFVVSMTNFHSDDSTSYINIGKRTDLRKINHNEIELRFVALTAPVTFIKIEVNAVSKKIPMISTNLSEFYRFGAN